MPNAYRLLTHRYSSSVPESVTRRLTQGSLYRQLSYSRKNNNISTYWPAILLKESISLHHSSSFQSRLYAQTSKLQGMAYLYIIKTEVHF